MWVLVLPADYREEAHQEHHDQPRHVKRQRDKRQQSDNTHECNCHLDNWSHVFLLAAIVRRWVEIILDVSIDTCDAALLRSNNLPRRFL